MSTIIHTKLKFIKALLRNDVNGTLCCLNAKVARMVLERDVAGLVVAAAEGAPVLTAGSGWGWLSCSWSCG